MKNKKGFTLIELLAVIVVLAIIALITIPQVLGMTDKAKESANLRSVEGHIENMNNSVASLVFESGIRDGIYTFDEFNFSNFPKKDHIRCEKYEVKKSTIIKAENCVINEKNYCYVGEGISCENMPSFSTDSWTTIVNNIRNGKAYLYAPANGGKANQIYRDIDLGELGVHTLRVANTTQCTSGEISETACGFVIEFADNITKVAYKSTGTTNGGYPNTPLYTYITETIYNSLPQELKDIIINTKVVSGHGSGDTDNIVSSHQKLYLFSMMEIFGATDYTIQYDTAYTTTRQLDYYRLNNSREARSKQNSAIWWTRTAGAISNNSFIAVQDSDARGFVNHHFSNKFGVSVAFRIG